MNYCQPGDQRGQNNGFENYGMWSNKENCYFCSANGEDSTVIEPSLINNNRAASGSYSSGGGGGLNKKGKGHGYGGSGRHNPKSGKITDDGTKGGSGGRPLRSKDGPTGGPGGYIYSNYKTNANKNHPNCQGGDNMNTGEGCCEGSGGFGGGGGGAGWVGGGGGGLNGGRAGLIYRIKPKGGSSYISVCHEVVS